MTKTILLTPKDKEDRPPLGLNIGDHFKRIGILNPAVVQDGEKLLFFSRLIYEDEKGLNSCIVENHGVLEEDEIRINKDDEGFPLERLVFQAESPHGIRGVEDFRLCSVKGENSFHGFLVHYDGSNARTEYIRRGLDNQWNKFGVWFPNIKLSRALELIGNQGEGRYKQRWLKEYSSSDPDELFLGTKDCALFPLKVDGKKGIIIRILPDMQIVYVNDPIELAREEYWDEVIENLESKVLLEREHDWERSHIGLAGPPFEIEQGVIIPYHGVIMEPERNYRFGLALVDKGNPQKVLARTKRPVLEATEPWEINGVVSGKVVFPTGHIVYNERMHWFYGAGDKYVACFSMDEKEMLKLLENKK